MSSMAGRLRAGAAVAVVASLALACTSGSGTPSPSASVEPPSPSPSVASPTPTPSSSAKPTTSPTAEPTLAPIERATWTWQVVSDAGPEVSVGAVREIRGRLYALGADYPQPAIWYSDDGVTWTSAVLPAPPAGLGFVVADLVDADDRLVAVASGGSAGGSGPFATAVYVSDDGEVWDEVLATPGHETGALFHLTTVGERIVATGQGAWASDDGGMSWTRLVTGSGLGGLMASVVLADDLLVAVGWAGTGELIEAPALVWLSADSGETWERQELPSGAYALQVAVLDSGRIVVAGVDTATEPQGRTWYSDDNGVGWNPQAAHEMWAWAVTPIGLVGASTDRSGNLLAWASTDGLTWTDLGVGLASDQVYPGDLSWGPRFGLSLAGGTGTIAFGPHPLR